MISIKTFVLLLAAYLHPLLSEAFQHDLDLTKDDLRSNGDSSANTIDLRHDHSAQALASSLMSMNVDSCERSGQIVGSLLSFIAGLLVGVISCIVVGACLIQFKSKPPHTTTNSKTKAGTAEVHETTPDTHEKHGEKIDEQDAESLNSMECFMPRCSMLVILMVFQSGSALILSGFQRLLEHHVQIGFYLTMIVGLGGNVGAQSVVLTVRRLALGSKADISQELRMGVYLCAILAPLAYFRCYLQSWEMSLAWTIAVAAGAVTVVAALLGVALPKVLHFCRIDPAHATAIIQVLMDMFGLMIMCSAGLVIMGA